MLAYLLSRPDDWKALVNDLKKRGNLGRDRIYTLLRELRVAGYICFERNRDAQGRMRGGTYIVSEVAAPHPGTPDADEPDSAASLAANPDALTNTDRNERTTTTTRPTNTHPAADVGREAHRLRFPDWLPDETHSAATRLVAGLNFAEAQLVIDEWAGALAAGAIQRSPLGYLKTLAVRCQAGDMSLRYAGVLSPSS